MQIQDSATVAAINGYIHLSDMLCCYCTKYNIICSAIKLCRSTTKLE